MGEQYKKKVYDSGDYYGFAITYTVRVDIRDEDGTVTQHHWHFKTSKEALLIYKLWANTVGVKVYLPKLEFEYISVHSKVSKAYKRNGWKVSSENALGYQDMEHGKRVLREKQKRFYESVRKLLYK